MYIYKVTLEYGLSKRERRDKALQIRQKHRYSIGQKQMGKTKRKQSMKT
jgi:hypothetical protein